MRMALGQFNATVGDIKNNVGTMRRLCAEAAGAELEYRVIAINKSGVGAVSNIVNVVL